MSVMFGPDKVKSLHQTLRVMKPNGILVANVWQDFDLVGIAGGLMQAVTGPPKEQPPPNPTGPMSLAEADHFDGLVTDAGFELTIDHNTEGTVTIDLGAVDSEQAFKMAAMPVWDALAEMEASGKCPDAWATARAAFSDAVRPFTDADGNVVVRGTYRLAVARKPPPFVLDGLGC